MLFHCLSHESTSNAISIETKMLLLCCFLVLCITSCKQFQMQVLPFNRNVLTTLAVLTF